MKSKRLLKIGARGSKLSLAQAKFVAQAIDRLLEDRSDSHSDSEALENTDSDESYIRSQSCKIIPIKTTGDILYQQPLTDIGGKNLFLKEIEEQLLKKEIDIAVHSLKDVSSILQKGLTIGAVLKREDPRDILILNSKIYDQELQESFEHTKEHFISLLKQGAIIGTCSNRRKVFLNKMRPDLNVIAMRGNIDTRIAKIESQNIDGIVIAVAGLKRLNLLPLLKYHHLFSIDDMIPAVGQGVICIECREDDTKIRNILTQLNCIETEICVTAERSFMRGVEGDCSIPLAAFASLEKNLLTLNVMLYNENQMHIHNMYSDKTEGVELGQKAAFHILSKCIRGIKSKIV